MLSDEQLEAIDELNKVTEKAINHVETDGNITDPEEPTTNLSKPPLGSDTACR